MRLIYCPVFYCKSSSIAELKGSTVNKYADDLFKKLWRYGEKNLESKSTLVIEMPGDALAFTYINWKDTKRNTNALRNVFDWNTAQIGIKLNAKDNYSNPNISLKTSAKSYKELLLTGYGIGKKGSKWRGSRVEFRDSK